MKLLVLIVALTVGCTEKFDRSIKDVKANWTGGLNRKCEVYTESGALIRTYEGKYDMQFGNDRVNFDKDGKRTIIVGAMVICDEKSEGRQMGKDSSGGTTKKEMVDRSRIRSAKDDRDRVYGMLIRAMSYLKQAKVQFTPNTTNSYVDDLISDYDRYQEGR